MSMEHDDLRRFRDSYLDYLEGDLDKPPALKGLPEKKRAAAEAFIRSITAARGIDPYASRPSIEELLARRSEASTPTAELSEVLQDHLRRTVDARASITVDAASFASGLASALLVQAQGMRIRIVPETHTTDLEDAITRRAKDIVKVFSAFPDSNAVLYTTVGTECRGVILDRGDVQRAIETPSGETREARLGRSIAHSATACEEWLKGMIPKFAPLRMDSLQLTPSRVLTLDPFNIARSVVREVSASGARAKIEEKRATWRDFGAQEAQRLVAIVQDAQRGPLSREDYESRLDELVGTAA